MPMTRSTAALLAAFLATAHAQTMSLTAAGYCNLTDSGNCVASPNYPSTYPVNINDANWKKCQFTVSVGLPLQIEKFELESSCSYDPSQCDSIANMYGGGPESLCSGFMGDYDNMELDGRKYCTGNAIPAGYIPTAAAMVFTMNNQGWTDSQHGGFKICQFAPPPAPPSPPGTCTNACPTANNMMCEDGGPRSDDNTCAYGTDCNDCGISDPDPNIVRLVPGSGHRQFDNCKIGCYQFMINDGICDARCNFADCGHNDCTPDEAITKCSAALNGGSLKQPETSNPVPDVTMRIVPKRLDIYTAHADFKATFMLRYNDERLFDTTKNPCKSAMPHIMGITTAQAADNAKLLAKLAGAEIIKLPVPQADLEDSPIKYVERTFRLFEKNAPVNPSIRKVASTFDQALTPHIDTLDTLIGPSLGEGQNSSSYASLAYTATLSIRQPSFLYQMYPFDRQVATITFGNSVNLSTCGTDLMLDLEAAETLLPTTSDWSYDANDPIRSKQNADGSCTIEIPIGRIWLPYFIQNILPGIIIVLAGLCGLFADPTAPPLVGGRTGLMIFAMLLSVNLSKGGLRYPYFMWTDGLLAVQLIILFTGLAETMVVHQYVRAGKKTKALAIDGVVRVMLPIMYLMVVLFLLIYALVNLGSGIAFLLVMSTVLFIISRLWFLAQYKWMTRARTKVLTTLQTTDDPDQRIKLLKTAFEMLDEDKSGSLETAEAVVMMRSLDPKLSKKEATALVKAADSDGFTFDEFVALVPDNMAVNVTLEQNEAGKKLQEKMIAAKDLPGSGPSVSA